ncbi:MAG: ferrochelatase [Micavibrio aeruginosavorus]|uniref:Ferrochelatase n=1 Tax=Micavibrio aeruginosavorus TaxID=349221 RepID=A0A2W5FSM7_9BACT|nr:MAG: ferrochelatase [Micavibrio aeruginosavorus]
MSDIQIPADHPPVKKQKVGVLLINLGTPDATDYWSVRRYLQEFLSDPRVIDLPRLPWQIILQLFILPRRPFASGHAYKMIWNNEKNESPLTTMTREQNDRLSTWLAQEKPDVVCDWAMRYGNPSIASKIEKLLGLGCDKILLFALYPQYSAATNATAFDKAFDYLKTLKRQPAIRTVPTYHDHPLYIDSIANSINAHIASLDWKPDAVIASFHGLPKRYLMEGDPYHCFCAKSGRLIREKLGLPKEQFHTTFQSRFGAAEWLKPYTDETVEQLAKSGVKNIAVVSPGFVSDCIETLEELNIRLRETFMENGGENFTYIPCLNASEAGIDIFKEIIGNELKGWA